MANAVFLGQAGWSLGAKERAAFPTAGTHLERYASRLNGVEINSSFYFSHQQKTYAKWAEAVPAEFRFAVKVPKLITHTRRLKDHGDELDRFLMEIAGLGPKLGPLLVQLPPSLAFEAGVADSFFADLRERVAGPIVCEARHATWFQKEARATLHEFHVSQVIADPAPCSDTAVSASSQEVIYLRLHGSPDMYRSAYSEDALLGYEHLLFEGLQAGKEVWCIFDNTAEDEALSDAFRMQRLLKQDADVYLRRYCSNQVLKRKELAQNSPQ